MILFYDQWVLYILVTASENYYLWYNEVPSVYCLTYLEKRYYGIIDEEPVLMTVVVCQKAGGLPGWKIILLLTITVLEGIIVIFLLLFSVLYLFWRIWVQWVKAAADVVLFWSGDSSRKLFDELQLLYWKLTEIVAIIDS